MKPQQIDSRLFTLRYVTVPFHPSLSRPLGRISGQHDIKVTHSSSNSLRNILTKTKTTPPSHLTPNTIYKISCQDCSSTYDGQTCRPLIERMKERKSSYRLNSAYDETLDRIMSAPARRSPLIPHYWTQHRLGQHQHLQIPSLGISSRSTEQAAIHVRLCSQM